MTLRLAVRSILRQRRRSFSTVLMVAIGTAALLVFGAFMLYSTYGLQTATVRANGHLTVYKKGYFTYGAGNPAAWGISSYKQVIEMFRRDAELSRVLSVATPIQAISGIISDAEADTSKTFFGTGFVPSERDKMTAWNPYGTASTQGTSSGISDDNVNGAVVGTGLAKVMGLCDRLHIADCPPPSPKLKDEPQAEGVSVPVEDFSFLEEAKQSEIEFEEDAAPIVQLLAATVGGAPNVIDVSLERAQYQGVKAIDDNYVGLNLKGAQQLVYGRGEPEATGIVLLLHETDSLEGARKRLERVIGERKLDLEVRDFIELSPVYKQATGLYQALFVFISGVIGLVVVFSVGNTVSMSVVERTQEIGTLRALGLNRRDVRRQFLTEGFILGITGATLGVILSFVTAYIVNGSNMSWTPPGNAQSVPIRLYMFGDWRLPLLIWFSLVCVAMVASVAPAIRASRLRITDALRYV